MKKVINKEHRSQAFRLNFHSCRVKIHFIHSGERIFSEYSLNFTCPCELSHERGPVLGVDLRDLLFPVDVRLIQAVDPAAAPVVAAGAEFTLRPAAAPQRTADDLLPLLPGRILNHKRFHVCFFRLKQSRQYYSLIIVSKVFLEYLIYSFISHFCVIFCLSTNNAY